MKSYLEMIQLFNTNYNNILLRTMLPQTSLKSTPQYLTHISKCLFYFSKQFVEVSFRIMLWRMQIAKSKHSPSQCAAKKTSLMTKTGFLKALEKMLTFTIGQEKQICVLANIILTSSELVIYFAIACMQCSGGHFD